MSYTFDLNYHRETVIPLLKVLEQEQQVSPKKLMRLFKQFPKKNGQVFSKDEVLLAYRALAGTNGLLPPSDTVVRFLQMKPMRTQSGVSPITVLTKPFPCPGKCIFCPNDVRMPKSYLADEPGAQRAERNWFDPYLQTYNRLQALHNIGHTVDKSEVIVLGGTWSFYPEAYQIWFIKECFRALNEFGVRDGREEVTEWYQKMSRELQKQAIIRSEQPKINKESLAKHEIDGMQLQKTYNQVVSELYVAPEKLGGFDVYQQASWEQLEEEQRRNETATVRCVGLVIETRPDAISPAEVQRIRRLGCTKTQIGLQSLQDSVLTKNKRGHTVAASRRAIKLLRQAGFKIHAHWMANLYGSSVEKDCADFATLFSDPDFRPDELKIYPCSLIGSAELMQYYKAGKWKPYSREELLKVVTTAIATTPHYCRLTRIIRDIPSTDIVEGNKLTNFRQIAEQQLEKQGIFSKDIRAREIRTGQFSATDICFEQYRYETSVSTEYFLEYYVPQTAVKEERNHSQQVDSKRIIGFLRLSLPTTPNFIDELKNEAIIREIHVYGKVVGIGKQSKNKPQHVGIGTKLIEAAEILTKQHGFSRLAVIAAIGTREYYRQRGFVDGKLYQHKMLT